MVHFEVVDELHIAMTLFGDTYRHRLALDNAGLDRAKAVVVANLLTVAVDNVPVDVGQTAGAAFDFVQGLKKFPNLWVHGV